ncbi:10693_t:CDS:1 [Funneliformis geosporum]|uniref:10693_t:CDS:1 n=1 Tax=Funneliformis geosporum TaxID=1117311 RepID=A0A9W4SAX5_9GLOM|nr:10693_t:CDS:1 [Funneliformis geosporum]
MSTKIKKNEKCLLCLKTGTAIIYDESTPQNKACFACSIKGVKESSEIIKVELEKLKKENKEVYKLRIQEIKIRFAEGKDELEKLKTEYPEFKSELEEIRQENLKAIPEEERDEVGGEKPTN